MGRNSCNVKQKLRKGLWSPEEDEKLHSYITRFGVGCWSSVPKLAGLQRCGKSCRLRWINYLRPDLKRGMFSQDEENLIISLHEALGNRWAQIAAQLPGRTDNEIKNFWNSCLKKKLIKQGIDPNTHKPTIVNEANNDYEEKLDDSSSVSHRQIILQPTILEQQHQQTYSNTVPTAVREINLGGSSKQVYDPLFLPEFQANVDPYSSFLSHNNCGIFNSMPNLTSFDNRNVMMDIESSSKDSSTIQMMINGGDVIENKFDSPMLFEYDRFSGIRSIDQDQQHKLLCQCSQDFSGQYPLMTSLSDQPLITDDQPNLQDDALFHDHI